MKKLLLILLATSVVSQNLFCMNPEIETKPLVKTQEPNKHDNIKRILDMVMGNKSWLSSIFKEVSAQYARNGQIPAEIMQASEKFQQAMAEDLCSDSMRMSLIDAYDRIYNDKEIADILKFYESETGQKLIQSLPELSVEMAKIMNTVMQKHLNNYMTEVIEISRKIQTPAPAPEIKK